MKSARGPSIRQMGAIILSIQFPPKLRLLITTLINPDVPVPQTMVLGLPVKLVGVPLVTDQEYVYAGSFGNTVYVCALPLQAERPLAP